MAGHETVTQLRAGALGLPSILMQGITHIAPAAGLLLTIQFAVGKAGVTVPLAFAIAFPIVLTLGLSLTQLAKQLPSAGGYYTYISRTVHPKAGFLTAWLYFLYDPTGAAINLAFVGYLLQQTLRAEYGVVVPWWLFFVIATLLIAVITYRGVEISARTMMLFGIVEIAILLALGVAGILSPGAGGVNASSYVPSNAPSTGGLCLGVIISIFSFTGFESVAPLAEESQNPRRNLPRAIIGSIILMSIFYLFCSWAVLVGWGTHDMNGLINSKENPVFLLARKLWGKAWILVPLALLNSVLGVSIACTNASTRVFYAMGRAGSLPRALARVHPVYRTPSTAIIMQTCLTLLFGLGLGFWIGPDQEFMFMVLALTLGLVFVYGAGNLGVFLFYRRERRHEFSVLYHVIFPLVSSVALVAVGIQSLVPFPAAPIGYAPFFVVGWLALGAVVMRWTRKEGMSLATGQTAFEEESEPR